MSPDLGPHVAPGRRQLVQPEQDVPAAGRQRAGQVAGRGPIWRQDERLPGAAAPTAKTVGGKDTQIDDVAGLGLEGSGEMGSL